MFEEANSSFRTPSLEQVERLFKRFAEKNGGSFNIVEGISKEERELNKSKFMEWLLIHVAEPVGHLLGEKSNEEETERLLKEHVKNVQVDCNHRNWKIRYQARVFGPKSSEGKKFSACVCCAIEPIDEFLLLFGKKGRFEKKPAFLKRPMIPPSLEMFAAEGMLQAFGRKTRSTYALQLVDKELDRSYSARSSDIKRGEGYLNDEKIRIILEKLSADLDLSIGFGDYTGRTKGPLWSVNLPVQVDESDALQYALELAQNSLDVLVKLGAIREAFT